VSRTGIRAASEPRHSGEQTPFRYKTGRNEQSSKGPGDKSVASWTDFPHLCWRDGVAGPRRHGCDQSTGSQRRSETLAAATVHSNMYGESDSDTETLARTLLPFTRHVCIFVLAVPSVTRTDHRQALLPRLRSASVRIRRTSRSPSSLSASLLRTLAELRLQGMLCLYRFSNEPHQTASPLRSHGAV